MICTSSQSVPCCSCLALNDRADNKQCDNEILLSGLESVRVHAADSETSRNMSVLGRY